MKPKFIVVDCETTGLDHVTDRLYGFSIATSDSEAKFYPIWDVPQEALDLLADPSIDKVNQNIKFDLKFLAQNGIEVKGRIWCTMILNHLINENMPTGQKATALRLLGAESLEKKNAVDEAVKAIGGKHVGDLAKIDLLLPVEQRKYVRVIGDYCNEDVLDAWKIFEIQSKKLGEIDKNVREVFQVEKGPLSYYINESMPACQVMTELELRGVRVRPEVFTKFGEELKETINGLEAGMRDMFEAEIASIEIDLFGKALEKRVKPRPQWDKHGTLFKWASGNHVGRLLYEKLEVSKRLTPSGGYCTNEEILLDVRKTTENERVTTFLDLFGKWRQTQKNLNTYVGNESKGLVSHIVPDGNGSGRMYPTYDPKTLTGRFSCENPNFQNFPRGSIIKTAFVPDQEDQLFVYADYSQVELRIAAHLSQDPTMLEAFILDQDPHTLTAQAIFGENIIPEQRQVGKTLNFALIFDAGAFRLQQEFISNGKDYSIEECKHFREKFFEVRLVYRQHLNRILDTVSRYGVLVSEAGRVRRIPEIVFGKHLNWRTKEFTGPQELINQLKNPGERPRPLEIFERASRKYSHAKKQAFNFPVQSLGASITKAALIALRAKGFTCVTTVHDSIIIQLKRKDIAKVAGIRWIMENCYKLSVPLKVDIKLLNSFDEKDKAKEHILFFGENKT